MADIFKVTVETLNVLQTILSPTFGPNGIDIILRNESGNIFVTNSGHMILDSLTMAHPMGLLVCEQAKRHIGLTGDGSKEIIILLANFLTNVYEKAFVSINPVEINAALSGIAQVCCNIAINKIEIIANYFKSSGNNSVLNIVDKEKIQECTKNILKTALSGKYCSQTAGILTQLIVDLIYKTPSKGANFFAYINDLIDNFHDVCIQVHGTNIENSSIINGLLIRQSILGYIDFKKSATVIKFAMLKNFFDLGVNFGHASLFLDVNNVSPILENWMSLFKKVVEKLNQNAINLILCNFEIPLHIKTLFINKFCFIQNLCDEDMKRISNYFEIIPIESIDQILYEDISLHVGHLSTFNEQIFGTEHYLKLCPDKTSNLWRKPSCHLVLCSPYPAIGQQYYSVILDMLKSIKMCFYKNYGLKEDRESYNSCQYLPAAGYFELCLAEFMEKEAGTATDEYQKIVYESLKNALMQIPKLLHKNSNQLHTRFIDIHKQILQIQKSLGEHSYSSFGIHGANGYVFDPCKDGVIEPFSAKILLFTHMLQIAHQILRIEQVLPAKTLAKKV